MTLDDLVARCFTEAMPRGDLTSRYLRGDDAPSVTRLVARTDTVLAGRRVIEVAVQMFAPTAQLTWQFEDGEPVLADQIVCVIKAPLRAVLTAESVALDLLGRACGIAARTRAFVAAVASTRAELTAPAPYGLRALDDVAIRAGGGAVPEDQRSDVVFVTNNLAKAAGSLSAAIARIRTGYGGPVAVECTSLDEVDVAVRAHVTRIILRPFVDVGEARARSPSFVPLEVRGRPDASEAARWARAGADVVRVNHLAATAPPSLFEFVPTAPQ